jgi:hypothetical protein
MTVNNKERGQKLAYSGKFNAAQQPDWDDLPPHHAEHQDDEPTVHASDEPDFDPSEYEVRERLHRLRVMHEARSRLDQELRPDVQLPEVKPLDVLLAEPDAPVRYRIDRLALDGARIMLSAQYKAGKTTIIGNLLRALADAEPFLGRFDVKIPAKRIALLDDELDENTLRRWLREQGIVNTAAIADVVSLRGRLGSFNLLDERNLAQWIRRLSDIGCDYLILDCLRPVLDSLGLDENKDAGKFLVPFDALLTGAGVRDACVVQHMGHTGERSRGDSRLQDWPDAIWRLVRESNEPDSARFFSAFGRDVNVTEGRLSYTDRRLIYSDGNRADAKLEAAIRDVLALLAADARRSGEGLNSSELEREVDYPQKVVRAAVKKLTDNNRVSVHAGAKNAKLHRISSPCGKCGLPVLTDAPRHESCGGFDAAELFL